MANTCYTGTIYERYLYVGEIQLLITSLMPNK